jgi:hypothetical protein
MSVKVTGTTAHDTACNLAEMQRQVSEAAATTQAALNTAAITYYRAVVASSKANNNSADISHALTALRQLGVNA